MFKVLRGGTLAHSAGFFESAILQDMLSCLVRLAKCAISEVVTTLVTFGRQHFTEVSLGACNT